MNLPVDDAVKLANYAAQRNPLATTVVRCDDFEVIALHGHLPLVVDLAQFSDGGFAEDVAR